jgi:hypothetical protein
MIRAPGGRLSNELAKVLERVFALEANSQVEIREPEVWKRPLRWPASKYYDGRLVDPREAISLIGEMLASADFWCRLVTNFLEVHVADDVVYIGMVGPGVAELNFLGAESVHLSPYVIDRVHFPYYPAANEEFWRDVRRDVDSGAGELLILQQWAAGFGGERWYYVASAGDLEDVQKNVIPRALYAVFRRPRLIRSASCSGQPISAVLGAESSVANVRCFRDLRAFPLSVEHVTNDDELTRVWRSLGDSGSVFLWEDDAVVSYVAQPDADGRVRVAASFQ